MICTKLEVQQVNKINVGIIGHGFVGQAVEAGFKTNNANRIVYDIAKPDTKLTDIANTDFVFICIPTEQSADDVEHAALTNAPIAQILVELEQMKYGGVVLIKSTMSLVGFSELFDRFSKTLAVVVNPEFLTERNAKSDFINSNKIIIGAPTEALFNRVAGLYKDASLVSAAEPVHLTPIEATSYKLMINTYLATKVSMFNEFRDILSVVSDTPWNQFVNLLKLDDRIGSSHTNSPGFDGHVGYGGKCLPACANTLVNFAYNQGCVSNTISGGVRTNSEIRPK